MQHHRYLFVGGLHRSGTSLLTRLVAAHDAVTTISDAPVPESEVTLNWLKQYVDFNWSPEELTERLTMLGLEVEGLEAVGALVEVDADARPPRAFLSVRAVHRLSRAHRMGRIARAALAER